MCTNNIQEEIILQKWNYNNPDVLWKYKFCGKYNFTCKIIYELINVVQPLPIIALLSNLRAILRVKVKSKHVTAYKSILAYTLLHIWQIND